MRDFKSTRKAVEVYRFAKNENNRDNKIQIGNN